MNKYKTDLGYELDMIIESLNTGIYITDEIGLTLEVNNAYKEMSGLNESELMGKNVVELLNSGIISTSGTLEVMKEQKPISFIQTIKAKSMNKHILCTCTPLYDEEGNFFRVLTEARDMTKLVKLEKELEESRITNMAYKENFIYYKSKLMLDKRGIVCNSKEMQNIIDKTYKISKYDTTTLICGESGVGKEVIVDLIYDSSSRQGKPFIKINCASLPSNLIESELFGFEKGSFTGADNLRIGIFEKANGGIVFLDEIGELSMEIQAKLLRVFQDKEIRKIGSSKSKKIDVRIILATNRNLLDMVKEGKFREDLYYRTNILSINIPPLRDRKDDIPGLVNFYIKHYNEKFDINKAISSEALQVLVSYNWPGNIRELKNMLERIVIFSNDKIIRPEDIPLEINDSKNNSRYPKCGALSLKKIVLKYERGIINQYLEEYGSMRKAAEKLDIHYSTISKKLKTFK